MESIFSEIPPIDFISISALFLLTMAVVFGVKERKHRWLNYVLLASFFLQWVSIVFLRGTLALKLFVTAMLLTVVVVELAVKRRRGSGGAAEGSA